MSNRQSPRAGRAAHRPSLREIICNAAGTRQANAARTYILMGADRMRAPTEVALFTCEPADIYASVQALRDCGGRGEAYELDTPATPGLINQLRDSRAARQQLRDGTLPGVRLHKIR